MGRDHVNILKNNQDAFKFYQGENLVAAVVCDGCGSGKHSEVGATMGARCLLQALVGWSNGFDWAYTDSEKGGKHVIRQAQSDMLRVIDQTVLSLAGTNPNERARIIEHYFLFTVVGVLILPKYTFVFSLGDGLFSVNGKLTVLEPEAGNEPVYLAYNLTKTTLKDQNPEKLRFSVQAYHTQQVESIVLASDGAIRIHQRQTDLVPNGADYVKSLEQFVEPDMFKNDDNVRRRLAIINKSGQKVDWQKQQITKYHGILNDDTTIVAIRRIDELPPTKDMTPGGYLVNRKQLNDPQKPLEAVTLADIPDPIQHLVENTDVLTVWDEVTGYYIDLINRHEPPPYRVYRLPNALDI